MGIGDLGNLANEHSDKINEQVDNAQEQHGDKLGQHKDTVNKGVDGAQDKFLNGGENKGVPLAEFKAKYTEIVEKILASGAKVAILGPTPVVEELEHVANRNQDDYAKFIRDFAAKRDLPFADMNGLFKTLIKAKADKKVREFTVDGTHLNERGNALFANEVVKTLAKATQADNKPVFVIDSLDNVARYGRLCKNFAPAFKFLQEKGWENLKADGSKFAIDGEKVFAFLQNAELKPWAKSLTEAHSAYIDIQVPLDGDEIFGVGRLDPGGAQKNFNGPDIRFYEQKLLPVKVRKGEFAMFLPPLGAHAPCCTDDGRKAVKKLVIKVLAD